MAIETGFSFKHDRPADRLEAEAAPGQATLDLLGLLRGFVGDHPSKKPQRKWRGKGFNMLWRPNFGGEFGPNDFFLELNLTDETLEFTDITGTGIANRGLLQKGIFLGGVAYLQTIDDSFDNSGQHFETGVWANVPATTGPAEPASVVRMGSIPHGTTINLQGVAFTAPAPFFLPASITPFEIGSPDDGKTNLQHFDEEHLDKPSASRTPLNRVASLTQAQLTNPNTFLSDIVNKQDVAGTAVMLVSSEPIPAPSTPPPPTGGPDVGGGTESIAFLTGDPTPNANAVKSSATFWVETIKDKHGHETLQLQYTQRVLLNFNGLSWPHVTVATLHPS